MDPKLKAVIEKRIDARNQAIVKAIGHIPGEVAEIAAHDRMELDEHFFRAYLPFFAGDEDLMYFTNDAKGRAVALAKWIGVAGGPYREVDVTKVVDGVKTIVFTVPAVLSRDLVKPTVVRTGEPSIYSAVLNANHLIQSDPFYAENYLKEKLAERYQRMQNPGVMFENAAAWNKIFAYYNRPPLPTKEQLAKDKSAAGDISKDEVLGFDPL